MNNIKKGFDWKEYLILAEYLQRDCGAILIQSDGISKEAIIRCAVSRSYYAAFCMARNALFISKKYPQGSLNDESAHSKVINYYQKQSSMPKVGDNLFKLREWRNDCDYEDNLVNLELILKSSIDASNKVFFLLNY